MDIVKCVTSVAVLVISHNINYYEHGICFKCRGEGVIVK